MISDNEQEEEQTEQQDGRPRRETSKPERLTYNEPGQQATDASQQMYAEK